MSEPSSVPAAEQRDRPTRLVWARCIGVGAFLFFLIKGLAWLAARDRDLVAELSERLAESTD